MATIRKKAWGSGSAYVLAWTDHAGNRHTKNFTKWGDADARRKEVERELHALTHRPDGGKMTMREVCERYIEYAERRYHAGERMTRGSFVSISGAIRNHILNAEYGVGHVTLAMFMQKRVRKFLDDMRDAGKSVALCKDVREVLSMIAKYAIGQEWTAADFTAGVSMIVRRGEESEKVIAPSKEAVNRLLAAADPDTRLKILFASISGLRAREQWGLRWRCIDFERRMVSVKTQIDAYSDERLPKTHAGIRDVPLPLNELREWRMPSPHSKDDDFVFLAPRGGRMFHGSFCKLRWTPLRAATGNDGLHWHALRHFAVSLWIESGLPLKTVSTFTGHASIAMTDGVYGHFFPRADHHDAIERIAAERAASFRQPPVKPR